MSVKSSTNESLLHLKNSTINPSLPSYSHCLLSRPSSFIFISYSIASIVFLLPLCIFILYHGLQQWRSTSSAATVSHSDIFTYHMVIVELSRVTGCTLCLCGIYSGNQNIVFAGFILFPFNWYAEIFFHILTCVERYLAVVHPITYMSLRRERGIRIRNICIGCVWVVCFAGIGLIYTDIATMILSFFLLIASFTIISFCSLSVLRVLLRSGPGEQVGRREGVDQSKLRAFYTIMAILGVLLLRLAWDIAWVILYTSNGSNQCGVLACDILFNLPSSLVLPLLFTYREGKLMCREVIK